MAKKINKYKNRIEFEDKDTSVTLDSEDEDFFKIEMSSADITKALKSFKEIRKLKERAKRKKKDFELEFF